MITREEYKISAVHLSHPYTQVFGQEAMDYLKSQGYNYVYVDDETGELHALSPEREVLNGLKLFKRHRAVMM